ncbi:MAG TPA: right-handed parallel beta-helix repeat-containing protein [Terriglobales bacterium]|nr:right-handed parallel beta-helix repeat-containing protein [Terriglobales bacterium]
MRKTHVFMTLVGTMVLLCGPWLSASSVSVGSCLPGMTHFATIQAAINASPQGGTVLVCPGVYPEQIAIFHPITIKGVDNNGSNLALITMPPGGTGAQIYVQATGVNLSDLTIDGSNNGATGCGQGPIGIYYWDSSGVINHVAIRNEVPTGQPSCFDGDGVFVVAPTGGASTVTIENSSIHSFQFTGIEARGKNANVTVKGNSIGGNTTGPAGNGVAVWLGASGTVSGNSIINVLEPTSYTYSGFYGAGWGVVVLCSQGVTVTGNTIGDTQAGVVVLSTGSNCAAYGTGNGDSNTIIGNNISQTHLFDGVYVCGNYNLVKSNVINGASEAGVNIDGQCNPGGSGYFNNVNLDTVDDACATSLVDPSVAGFNTVGSNKAYSVSYDALSGLIPLTAGTCNNAPAAPTGSGTVMPRTGPPKPV